MSYLLLPRCKEDILAPRHAAFHYTTVLFEKILALKNYQLVERYLFFAVSFSASLVSLYHIEVYYLSFFWLITPLLSAETLTLATREIF